MKSIVIIVLTFLSISMASNVQAQIVTDRPDQTESSSTVGHGDLQIESGILIGYEGNGSETTRQLLAPTNLFRYGITKGIELRLLSQFETLKNTQSIEGISDIEIGAKIQLLRDPSKNTEIAFLSHLVVPTGTTELGNDSYGTINKLSISHAINDRMGVGYNVGYNYFGIGQGDLTYSIALGISVNDRVGVYVEPFGSIVNIEEHQSSFDTGFTYLVNDNLQLDFSFGTGINHPMNYISVGASWLMNSDRDDK